MASLRREVQVRDILHGLGDWQVLVVKDIEQATVARLFQKTGLTQVPVMETGESGEQRLRGLLSVANVQRLLVR